MHKTNQKRMQTLLKSAALGVALVSMAGCVIEPEPPPGPVAAYPAPGPAPYYGCCAYYNDYPPYYYGGPALGVGVGYYGGGYGRGWGYHHWR